MQRRARLICSASAAAVRARRTEGRVQRAAPAGLHPVAARPLHGRQVPVKRERLRPAVQRGRQEAAGRLERQAARRADGPRRLLLRRHGAHRTPREER